MALSFAPREIPVLSVSKKNSTGAPIVKGKLVKLNASNDDEILLCAADTDAFFGITRADIPIGEFGDIGVIGQYAALAGGSVTRGQKVGPDATGNVIAVTVDKKTIAGLANRSAASTELFEIILTGPGLQASI